MYLSIMLLLQIQKRACDKFDPTFYPRFKKWCDDYFYIKVKFCNLLLNIVAFSAELFIVLHRVK